MIDLVSNLDIEDVHVTEKDKNKFYYIRSKTDYFISSLVAEKLYIKKCRNLYEGVRDPEEYAALQSVYGLETPMALRMTPLIKTRIDVLVGLFLDEIFTYQVSVNDAETLDKILEERTKAKFKKILEGARNQMDATLSRVLGGQKPQVDVFTDRFIKQVEESIENGFISEFEKMAQSLIAFFERDKTIDLKQKLKQMFIDLLITGECYYRTFVDRVGQDPIFEVCKPENVFYSKNTNHQFITSGHKSNTTAVVHRFYMTRSEVLSRWGHKLSDVDKKYLFGEYSGTARVMSTPYDLEPRYARTNWRNSNQFTVDMSDTVEVYHTEWLANNEVSLTDEEIEDYQTVVPSSPGAGFVRGENSKVKKTGYKLNRYESIRIGTDIYVDCGKSLHETRSAGAPHLTTLTYNGVCYNDRNGSPYSLAWSMKDIQDLYDITKFHRDNMIANSGVNGTRVNLAGIPKALGAGFMERVLKFMALRKQGVELIDPTEPGAALFQHYGDFKAALEGDVITALQTVLESIQQEADIISGVNRHMYQAAEQRDAVNNVKVGIKQTSLITKDLFDLLFATRENVLTDLINRARVAYIKGKRGSYIMGKRVVFLEIIPEKFCFTDYNIHILNTSRDHEKVERVKAIMTELIKIGSVDSEIALKVTMSDSASEILDVIENNIRKNKMENDELAKMKQHIEQLTGERDQIMKEMENARKELEKLNKDQLGLRSREIEIKEKQMMGTLAFQNESLDLQRMTLAENIKKDTAALQLEREQIHAENVQANTREVRNDI
jgi:hypothetical protein